MPQYWEMYRAAEKLDLREQLTEDIHQRFSSSPNLVNNIEFIKNKNSDNSVLLFDTNLIHKGNYISDDPGSRCILEFQFNSAPFIRLFT